MCSVRKRKSFAENVDLDCLVMKPDCVKTLCKTLLYKCMPVQYNLDQAPEIFNLN